MIAVTGKPPTRAPIPSTGPTAPGRGMICATVGDIVSWIRHTGAQLSTRTGILRAFGAEHLYGPRCYAPTACASSIERLASKIDARQFTAGYPANSPGSSSTRFGDFALNLASTAVTAIASTTGKHASRPNVRCSLAALAYR